MSNDSYTEVTHQSWFKRLGNAFKGIIIGIILVVVSFGLLFWNEGRSVKRHKTLQEGGGAVISISADILNPENDGKLVHLSGMATTDETLSDEVFGIGVNALKLERAVEMYQWQESQSSEEKKKLGGGTETVTKYTYSKTWASNLINSGDFKKPEGHRNPDAMPFESEVKTAQDASIGAFSLSPSLIGKIHAYTPVSLNSDYTLPETLEDQAQVTSNTLFFGSNPASPRIGDVRISFKEVKPRDISLVARQKNSSFEPYIAKAGGTIELLVTGIQNAESMFQQAEKSNTILTWVLRAVGFFVMFLGFKTILAPLSILADVLPILGSIAGAGTSLVSGLIAVVLSLLTISIAWFVYRPLLGIIIIALAGGAGFLLFIKLRKNSLTSQPAER